MSAQVLRSSAVLLLTLPWIAAAEDFASLCADRAAIERVYYNHRLGEKPPFENVLPKAMLENLVRLDLRKEAALKKTYGFEITPAILAAEVQRINTTTRAPEMLAEIKTALGNNPMRFANAVARPILVERELRQRFENDDKLHAVTRRVVEETRTRLLAAKAKDASVNQFSGARPSPGAASSGGVSALELSIAHALAGLAAPENGRAPPNWYASVTNLLASLKQDRNHVSEMTWQLGARQPEISSSENPDELVIKKRFGPDAQMLTSPGATGSDSKLYFDDLPAELQQVLRVQLRQPADVSAVIEMPADFAIYLCTEKTPETLRVAVLRLRKRNYDEWLNEQDP